MIKTGNNDEILEKFGKCNDCEFQWDFSIYVMNRTTEVESVLEKAGIKHICGGFIMSEGEPVAELGTFEGIGCEMFHPRSERSQEMLDRRRKQNQ